jgi:hypothetical protein
MSARRLISIDTKKKELLGEFFRPGQAYTDGQLKVLDHDFPPAGQSRLIPYGVYDVAERGPAAVGHWLRHQ